MKDVTSLIKNLRDLNVRLSLNRENNIEIDNSGRRLSDDVLQAIRDNKDALVSYFRKNIAENIYSQVTPVGPQENYPLSSSQQRLWVLSQFDEGNIAYHVSGAHMLEGKLQRKALSYAFDRLVERHESLRTVFRENEAGEVRQYILPAGTTQYSIESCDLRSETDPEDKLKNAIQAQNAKPFDLAAGPLLRATLFTLSGSRWVFSYVMHHIISDGWSMNILIKELMHFYNAWCKGEQVALAPLTIQYKDFASWQRQQLQSNQLEPHRHWWLKHFEGELPVINLPYDKLRPPVKTYNGHAISRYFKPALTKSIRQLATANGATTFMVLLAAVKGFLYRYTSQSDIVIGSSIASRQHSNIENQIGFYVNTLALRTRFNGHDSFTALLRAVKQVTLDAYEHQVYPFDELINDLQLQRDLSRHPLFDVMVVLKNMVSMAASDSEDAEPAKTLGDLTVSDYDGGSRVLSKFDITFFFNDAGDGLSLRIVYNTDLFTTDTIGRLANHLEQFTAAAIQHPALPIHEIDYLDAGEKKQLLIDFNNEDAAYPEDKTIIQLFESQAALTPDNIAVEFGDRSLTYRQLDLLSDQLAGHLVKNCHVGAGHLVGIMLDRSDYVIIALLGIMKSGAAYVPIEPGNPKDRTRFVMEDAAISALVTETRYLFDLDHYNGNVFGIDVQLDDDYVSSGKSAHKPQPGDAAYVIYTSGSTGTPKGVVISHRSVVDYFYGLGANTNISDCKTFALVSTFAADLGNTVIYASLLTGGTLQIFSEADIMDPEKMNTVMTDCIKIVPSHWKALQQPGKLFAPRKSLIFGGEQLTKDIVEYISSHNGACTVFNHYGPTETTVGKLIHQVDIDQAAQKIPLGKPFCQGSVHLLDAHLQLCPIGVAAEICISGNGLASGYLNAPELTREKFVQHPFKPGQLIYKTGDLGKRQPDGTILYLGRKDKQLKVRGYRIEPGEIENALQHIPGVKNAIVITRLNKSGEAELAAYFTANKTWQRTELQRIIGETLPAFMLPQHYVQLPEMPHTLNGKIDARKLPDPEGIEISYAIEYVAPRNDIEEKLAEIWQEVLVRERIGVKDNFFELGGHSIKAVQLISRMNAVFRVRIDIQTIFEEGNIESIAQHINFVRSQSNRDKTKLKEIEI